MENMRFTFKPLDIYIKEIYELAEKIEIEPIDWKEVFENLD